MTSAKQARRQRKRENRASRGVTVAELHQLEAGEIAAMLLSPHDTTKHLVVCLGSKTGQANGHHSRRHLIVEDGEGGFVGGPRVIFNDGGDYEGCALCGAPDAGYVELVA